MLLRRRFNYEDFRLWMRKSFVISKLLIQVQVQFVFAFDQCFH